MFILVNTKTGNYFGREIADNEEGRCVDVDTIAKAKKFNTEFEATRKAQFIGGIKYSYKVVEIN